VARGGLALDVMFEDEERGVDLILGRTLEAEEA
jgi:hypothetical protein